MLKDYIQKISAKSQKWAEKNLAGLFVFNLAIVFLVLLRYAGYFSPFLTININFIYITSLIMSVFLLKLKSRHMMMIAISFWILAAFLKSVKVDIWADRTVEYFFQALFLGIVLLFTE